MRTRCCAPAFAILIVAGGGIAPRGGSSFSFVRPPPATAPLARAPTGGGGIFAAKPRRHPEYSIDDDDGGSEESAAAGGSDGASSSADGGDFFSVTNEVSTADGGGYFSATLPEEEGPGGTTAGSRQKPEYGALSQGTVVRIQSGDIALARKAWKKRRRSGSPLLVPCSILNVDRQSMVRWNLIYLLEKFGRSRKDGIQISASDLAKKYRTFLKSSLKKQADALSYPSNGDMIRELFDKKIQESYGIRLVEKKDDGGGLLLKAPISKAKAHRRIAKTPILQFRLPKKGDHGDAGTTMTHTGYLRTRKEDSDSGTHGFVPLSAALRVTQRDDVDTGRVKEGSIHPAVVFDYDPIGDGGSPLLTLSLNPRGTRDSLKVQPDRKYAPIEHPELMFGELSVGKGPYRAKVVQMLPGRALVDMRVGRKVAKEGGSVNVLGTLQFKDSVEVESVAADRNRWLVENDDYDDDSESVIAASLEELDSFDDYDEESEEDEEEEGDLAEQLLALRDSSSFEEGTFEDGEVEEDISDQFEVGDDGTLIFHDPESGEQLQLDDDEGDNEKAPKGFQKVREEPAPKKRKKMKIVSSKDVEEERKNRMVSKHLNVGDVIDVYVRTVSKQSGQFSVSTNAAVRGRKAKDLKREQDNAKKLKHLKESLGGDLSLIYELEGSECDGTVKAASKTGDWVYVDPDIDGLPVGVAALGEGLSDVSSGDRVRLRIEGIDEGRGQLALQVLDKR